VETRKAAPTPAPAPIVIVREPAPAPVPKKAIEGFISLKSATGHQFVEIRTDENLVGHSWFAAMTEERVDRAEELELARAQEAANAALPRITPAELAEATANSRREGQSTAHNWWLAGLGGILAAIVLATLLGWVVHGCGHEDVPPALPAQTVMVQPAQVPAPTCDPVVVNPVVVTTPPPVVNLTVPEQKVIYRTTVREVPAPVAPASAGTYSMNVRVVPAAPAPAQPPAQAPAAPVSAVQVPAAQVPAAPVSAVQVPAAQVPAAPVSAAPTPAQ